MEKHKLVHIALENLEKHTLIKGKWNSDDTKELDGTLELKINNKNVILNIEVKSELRTHQVNQIVVDRFAPLIIVANKIYPNVKEDLRQRNIAYLDISGNIYLSHDGIFLWIEGQKNNLKEKENVNRAFTKTGLKVLFNFLQNEETIQMPYREIAQEAQVSLGNINNVMNGLKEMGFLLKLDEQRYKLHRKKELLYKWITTYEERLKPSLYVGAFRFLKEEDFKNWKKLPVENDSIWWGGEPAGDLITDYLRPGELTIYTTETLNDLMKKLRLIPDENGNVKVYNKFWNDEDVRGNLVPPLLVYADLLNTQDSRCIETASKIYDLFLKDEFEGN